MDTIDTYDWEAANDRPQPRDTANDTAVFGQALAALAAFDQTFGRPLTPSFVAELHVARMLGLRLRRTANAPGFDAWDAEQRRYEIKYRQSRTINPTSAPASTPAFTPESRTQRLGAGAARRTRSAPHRIPTRSAHPAQPPPEAAANRTALPPEDCQVN